MLLKLRQRRLRLGLFLIGGKARVFLRVKNALIKARLITRKHLMRGLDGWRKGVELKN
jgi:hypothetical protein